ncbi:MAG: gamma-glutamylcyclotransferase [Pseudomonadota bacterium]
MARSGANYMAVKDGAPAAELGRRPDVRWVFGYGSLMWRPDFPHVARVKARLAGYRRSLCVYSVHHRGTPEAPGLVFGLDRGGSCQGVAFAVEASAWDDVMSGLRAREQVTSVYLERQVRVRLDGGATVDAVVYVVDRAHPQYAADLAIEDQARLVARSKGQSGDNVSYVCETARRLDDLGVRDARLTALVAALER